MSVIAQASEEFRYQVPERARGARFVIVKPNLGYPKPHPVTVSTPVLVEVLRALREASPAARIAVLEGSCDKKRASEIFAQRGFPLLAPDVEWLDADKLPCREYRNRNSQVFKYASIRAPEMLGEADCCISVAPCKRTILKEEALISASIKNLFGLLPTTVYRARSAHSRGQLHRPDVQQVIADVYGCLRDCFAGSVVDVTEAFDSADWRPDRGRSVVVGQVVQGDSLADADREACRLAGFATPRYLGFGLW